jgi:DNA-binding response OmpR family regulator
MTTNQLTIKKDKQVVMVVDDEPANLKLLDEILRQEGYTVRLFPRGRMALAAAQKEPPDLFLLDVNMPELSGYQVCEQIKADPRLASIPVMFLSALTETDDKVKSFQSGGVDYISKPFQLKEVYARVDTQLKLYSAQKARDQQNELLEEMVAARTRELSEAHARLTALDQTKDDFLKIISHELRTPLNGILGIGELVLDELPPSPENDNLRRAFHQSRQRMISLLDDSLLLTEVETNRARPAPAPHSLASLLAGARERTADFAQSRDVTVAAQPVPHIKISGSQYLLIRAFQALLETAIKFSEAGGTVQIKSRVEGGSLRVAMQSQGWPIAPSAVPKFFDVFAIGEALTPGGDIGLGPPLARRILELFGGAVTIENTDPPGVLLTVTFPSVAQREGVATVGASMAHGL